MPPIADPKQIDVLDEEYRNWPDLFRLKTLALASVGQAYALAWLLLAFGGLALSLHYAWARDFEKAAGSLFAAFLGTAFLIPLVAVRHPAIPGRLIDHGDCPRLFELIDKIRRKAKGPRFEEVRLTDEFNASVALMPRFGVLGGYRFTLLIGLPLLQALSRKEFAAVLAHEYGHVAGAGGKLNRWVSRARINWTQLHESLQQTRSVGGLNRPFVERFVPVFTRYAAVLARHDEYDADRLASRIVGRRTMGDALVAVALRGRFVGQHFWSNLWAQADHQPKPTYLPHTCMRTALSAGFSPHMAREWLKEAMDRHPFSGEAHPNLRDRLLALDVMPEFPPESRRSAAQTLIGPMLIVLLKEFDEDWLTENREAWQRRYTAARAQRANTPRL